MGPKIIYLAEPNGSIPRSEWPARWRKHGELNRNLPLWRHLWRYEQDLVQPVPAGIAGLVPGLVDGERFGGVGVCVYRSDAAVREMRKEPDHPAVREDELETFATTVEHFTVVAQEEARRERGPTSLKLMMFLRRSAGSRADFWRSWRRLVASDRGHALVAQASEYVENPTTDQVPYPVAQAGPPDRDRFPDFDGVVEIGFRDADSLRSFGESSEATAAFDAVHSLLDPKASITILVKEVILFDELEQIDWLPR